MIAGERQNSFDFPLGFFLSAALKGHLRVVHLAFGCVSLCAELLKPCFDTVQARCLVCDQCPQLIHDRIKFSFGLDQALVVAEIGLNLFFKRRDGGADSIEISLCAILGEG